MQVCEALTAISEAVGPQFVMAQLHKRAAGNKNPKVLSEALAWIADAIPEFGLGVMDVKGIIEWMKADLGSANAPGVCAACSRLPSAAAAAAKSRMPACSHAPLVRPPLPAPQCATARWRCWASATRSWGPRCSTFWMGSSPHSSAR